MNSQADDNQAREPHNPHVVTIRILYAMVLGAILGIAFKFLPIPEPISTFVVTDVLASLGKIFINLLKMLVVPVVFVSLVCGSSAIELKKLGRVGGKTLLLYLFTTAFAIALALLIALSLGVGNGLSLTLPTQFTLPSAPSVKQVILDLFPSNPFQALAEGNMLQVIIFSLLFGVALTLSGQAGQKILKLFRAANDVIMTLILLIMKVAPYGVFCLMATLFAKMGFGLIGELIGYFVAVLLVLMIHLTVTYSLLLRLLGQLSPMIFFRKMYAAMLFAFSVSSSSASIPVVLETVEERLGVHNSVAAFVIPLGATINMDGTAIMQGVATVFIAHAYGLSLGLTGYLTVIAMATLASIGTAGVPSVGLITLAMVLNQVGLPVEGIGLIIGIDRLLDMARTAVNVCGDAMVSCVVGKSEDQFDAGIYSSKSPK